jgi:hypothetical protein
MQTYDLRPLLRSIDVELAHDGLSEAHGHPDQIVTMCLQASPEGAGRPDEVLDALGLTIAVEAIERTNLNFEFDK